jgi:hypothetical protein
MGREAAARQDAAEPVPRPHFAPRAKRVIHIFSCGGVSQVDTFDHKPELEKFDGRELSGKGAVDTFFGRPGRLMKSPFRFRRHGQCGRWVSDLLPNLAELVDEMAFVHSMVSPNNNHTPATFLANSGFAVNGFPCMGAWASYGLGAENDELPSFIVLPDPRGLPAGGSINWTAGFLPAQHQGTPLRSDASEPIADLRTPAGTPPAVRAAGWELLRDMERGLVETDPSLSARLRTYELAARMQGSVAEAADLSAETEETRRLYGLDRKGSAGFGRNCLLARRLVERGVRFVQLFNGGAFGGNPRINWDAHEDVVSNHRNQAEVFDRPAAGLLLDLKRRGLLDDTLVVWSTEFGRTPMTEGIGKTGRDHHQHGFTCWLAGAGVRKGIAWGATDEVGYHAAENPATVYDFHATILHLLGLDHTRLTFYHNGIRRRLTDVHGQVVPTLLA